MVRDVLCCLFLFGLIRQILTIFPTLNWLKMRAIKTEWRVVKVQGFFGQWLKMPPAGLGDGQKTVLRGRR